jgi:hypothetical protein
MPRERTAEELAKVIADFFLDDAKWEVDKDDGWVWLYDANYGFDPVDLATLIIKGVDDAA